MITAIEIENFKAFGERQRIEFRPITLLFGPNSGGKSSVIHAIHLAREIFVRRVVNVHRPESGGDSLDLGGIHSFIHGRRLGDRPTRLKFEFSLDRSALPELRTAEGRVELSTFVEADVDVILNRIDSASIEIEISPSSEPFVSRYLVAINGEPLAELTAAPRVPHATLERLNWRHPLFESVGRHAARQLEKVRLTMAEVDRQRRALRGARKRPAGSKGPEVGSEPDRVSRARTLESAAERLVDLENRLLDLAKADEGTDAGALAALFEAAGLAAPADTNLQTKQCDGALPWWGRTLQSFSPLSTLESRTSEEGRIGWSEVDYVLTLLVTGPGQVLRDLLEKFRYIGPLRMLPTRGWQAPILSKVAGWPSGLTAWQILRDEPNEPLLAAMNRWLSSKECFDTEYSLHRVAYQELPTEWAESLAKGVVEGDDVSAGGLFRDIRNAPERYRLDLRQRDRRLELQDVGVGISQVLPVLVGALEPSAALVSFEQPELHLHPKQQAALGDLFIEAAMSGAKVPLAQASAARRPGPIAAAEDLVATLRATVGDTSATDATSLTAPGPPTRDGGRVLLVETHSEHFILRIMRRIRETTAGVAPAGRAIDRSQLMILHVEHVDGASRVLPMRLDKDGDLLQPWPDTFFDQDAMERFGR